MKKWYAFLVMGLFLTRSDLWLYTQAILPERPWIVLGVVFAPVLLWAGFRVLIRPQDNFLRSDSLLVLVTALLVGAIELAGIAKYESLPTNTQVVAFFWLDIFTVVCGYWAGRALREHSSRTLFTIALAVVAASVLVDWKFPGIVSQSSLYGRPSGLLENPNGAAFAVVILLIGALDWNPGRRARPYMSFILVLVTIILSGSRGGFVAVMGVLTIFWLSRALEGQKGPAMIARIVRGYALIGVVVVLSVTIALSARSRFVELATHGVTSDYSAQERVMAISESWFLVVDSPLVGHGTGYVYTMPLGPHNMFLRVWIENGLIGVIAYAALWIALAYMAVKRRSWQLGALEVAALLMGAVSHNVLEDRTLLLSFGVILAIGTLSQKSSKSVSREPALGDV